MLIATDFSAEMEQIHAENNIFKYADDRGEGGEEQNRKNKDPQDPSANICVKIFGSVINTSPGPAAGSTPKAKHARDDDQSCHQCHKRYPKGRCSKIPR